MCIITVLNRMFNYVLRVGGRERILNGMLCVSSFLLQPQRVVKELDTAGTQEYLHMVYSY